MKMWNMTSNAQIMKGIINYHFSKKWHLWQLSPSFDTLKTSLQAEKNTWRNKNLGLKGNFNFERNMICDHVWWGRPYSEREEWDTTDYNGKSAPGKEWNREGWGNVAWIGK